MTPTELCIWLDQLLHDCECVPYDGVLLDIAGQLRRVDYSGKEDGESPYDRLEDAY